MKYAICNETFQDWPFEKAAAVFRERAIERGYLYRSIPKQYGGSEQPPDVLKGQVIREEFGKRWAPLEARGIGTMMLVPTLLSRRQPTQSLEISGFRERPDADGRLLGHFPYGEADADQLIVFEPVLRCMGTHCL